MYLIAIRKAKGKTEYHQSDRLPETSEADVFRFKDGKLEQLVNGVEGRLWSAVKAYPHPEPEKPCPICQIRRPQPENSLCQQCEWEVQARKA